MLFNTISFALFLPIVFGTYWFLFNKNLKYQNFLLLGASYFFYACWDYRFLFLLVFSTFLDFISGIQMSRAKEPIKLRLWFWLSVVTNLGFLATFKYYNFFASSFAEGLSHIGIQTSFTTLNIILPVGISFYTFHGLSYVIDIYKGKIQCEKNFIDYAVFVSFFPLLVAGPIERATYLLPQVKTPRLFIYGKAVDGLRQILWGLFKKIVIADSCAYYVDMIFGHSGSYNGSTLVMGAFLFAFQIYCDFSGYSDMALGIARLFGIELINNFAFPYFSRDIAEFWRRWHISLTTWFRDYIYIPLGGSRGRFFSRIINTFIIFILSGFWHGASWTFIVWGGVNAFYFTPLLVLNKNRKNLTVIAEGRNFPSFYEVNSMVITFCLITFAWIFFRAESIYHAHLYVKGIFSLSLFSRPQEFPLRVLFFIFFLLFVEWIGRENSYALKTLGRNWPMLLRWSFYIFLAFLIFLYFGKEQAFIYFNF